MARKRTAAARGSGSDGWDEYAPFYDWENARTFGRRDLAFWRRVLRDESGPALELGCGTGRLLMPLARSGARVVGVDRSAAMLGLAHKRAARLARPRRPPLVLGDVRTLPFASTSFGVVLAPYGLLQSLLTDRDLDAALGDAARVLRPGGLLGIDLVPDLPGWAEYGSRIRLRGRTGRGGRASVTLVESVRQDRRRGLTIFDEEFIETRGGQRTRRCFSLTFRTQPLPRMLTRLAGAGFRADAVFGDYERGPWHARADAWLILARKV